MAEGVAGRSQRKGSCRFVVLSERQDADITAVVFPEAGECAITRLVAGRRCARIQPAVLQTGLPKCWSFDLFVVTPASHKMKHFTSTPGDEDNPDWTSSASSVNLVTWLKALHGGKVLQPESYAEMATQAKLNDGTTVMYGLPLFDHARVWAYTASKRPLRNCSSMM